MRISSRSETSDVIHEANDFAAWTDGPTPVSFGTPLGVPGVGYVAKALEDGSPALPKGSKQQLALEARAFSRLTLCGDFLIRMNYRSEIGR